LLQAPTTVVEVADSDDANSGRGSKSKVDSGSTVSVSVSCTEMATAEEDGIIFV
jgi:hypothetical protein